MNAESRLRLVDADEAVVRIGRSTQCPVRIRAGELGDSDWSTALTAPARGYLEAPGLGPVPVPEIESVDFRAVYSTKPHKYGRTQEFDRLGEITNLLAAEGVAYSVVEDGAVVRVE